MGWGKGGCERRLSRRGRIQALTRLLLLLLCAQSVGGNGPSAPASDALPEDGWLVGARPAAAAAAAQSPEAAAAPAAAEAGAGAGGGGAAAVAGVAAGVGGLQLDDEEEGEEEDGHNPYDDPYRAEDEGEVRRWRGAAVVWWGWDGRGEVRLHI